MARGQYKSYSDWLILILMELSVFCLTSDAFDYDCLHSKQIDLCIVIMHVSWRYTCLCPSDGILIINVGDGDMPGFIEIDSPRFNHSGLNLSIHMSLNHTL